MRILLRTTSGYVYILTVLCGISIKMNHLFIYFDVFLTVHHSIDLFQITNLMLSTGILYGRLQRVTIPEAVIIQFDLLKMSIVDCSPLSTCILYGRLQRVTIPEAVIIQSDLLKMSIVLLETC